MINPNNSVLQHNSENHIKEKDFSANDDEWDDEFKKDIGIESESASQATSNPNESTNNIKTMNYLDEVIEEVIQEAIQYFDSPSDTRVLPPLVRKYTRAKVKPLTNSGNAKLININVTQTSHQTVSASENNALLMSSTPNNPSGFHPLVQANLTSGMQQMLQLAAASKSGLQIAGSNVPTTLQHVNGTSQQQQSLTNPMMGLTAAQLQNVIMPSYSTNLPSNYSQTVSGNQYQLPVSLSQIQLAQQQSPHLLLGNNPSSFSDLSTNVSSQQQNLSFSSGITNPNSQLMPPSNVNFGTNSAIAMSPYQIPGMIQSYTQSNVSDSQSSNAHSQNETVNSALNLNGNPSNVSCFQPSKTSNAALPNNSASPNHSISAATQSVSSLYQTSPFDLQQSQLYAQQRLLQSQQNQQLTTPGLFPDYAAVMARYSAYH